MAPPEKPRETSASRAARQFAVASELPFLLVGPVFVGGAAGYFLDRWLHTQPLLMFILGLLGFFAGAREMMRRFKAMEKGNGSNRG